ncbi:hypothetical protein EDB83DRAFT_1152619 [Lactarius deliciosus]|nr:hypothetical protein EDB83DRAFT_1152619 [Lactarius deliciosus]
MEESLLLQLLTSGLDILNLCVPFLFPRSCAIPKGGFTCSCWRHLADATLSYLHMSSASMIGFYRWTRKLHLSILLRGMLSKQHIYFAAITHLSPHRSTSGVLSVIMSNAFASRTIVFFLPVPYLRCARSYSPRNLSSQFNRRYCRHNVCTISCALRAVIHTRVLSHRDVAYIRVFWEEQNRSRCYFNHHPRSFRRYYLGDLQSFNPSVPRTFVYQGVFLIL